jgi:hypothetical protein
LGVEAVEGHGFGHAVDDEEGAPVGQDPVQVPRVAFQGCLGVGVVEAGGDEFVGDLEGLEAGYDAGGLVFEVEVDDVAAVGDLFGAGALDEPALEALGFSGEGVDVAGVDQPVAVGAPADGGGVTV